MRCSGGGLVVDLSSDCASDTDVQDLCSDDGACALGLSLVSDQPGTDSALGPSLVLDEPFFARERLGGAAADDLTCVLGPSLVLSQLVFAGQELGGAAADDADVDADTAARCCCAGGCHCMKSSQGSGIAMAAAELGPAAASAAAQGDKRTLYLSATLQQQLQHCPRSPASAARAVAHGADAELAMDLSAVDLRQQLRLEAFIRLDNARRQQQLAGSHLKRECSGSIHSEEQEKQACRIY